MNGQKARVTVKREHSLYSCAVIFGVYVDGMKVGSVANGGEATFEIEPGKHTLECKESFMGRLVADGAPFEIQAGERLEFCLRCSGFVLMTFLGLIPLAWLSSGFRKRYFRRFTLSVNKK
ncbi:MAG: hypothetical protein IJE97_05985 [Thermoguttaceae bacterium]|nr:hypothetical protein [Thermoguttaceae bacterium]